MRKLAYILLGFCLLGLIAGAYYLVKTPPERTGKLEAVATFFSPKHELKLLFVGDMMFDRTIRQKAETKGYPFIFEPVAEYLKTFDLVVGNLEGPITASTSVSVNTLPEAEGNMRFTFDAAVAKTLYDHNIRLVTLGNNHILDFGKRGVLETKKYLGEASVSYVGNPNVPEENVRYIEQKGIKLGFVSFNQFLGRDVNNTLAQIKDAEAHADTVVVLSHWGEEYATTSVSYVLPWARSFIDAGADLVIGAHPHVVEQHEDYNGGRIYYSLGNFIFDQYWRPEVRCGEGVEVLISKKGEVVSFAYIEHQFSFSKERQVSLGCSN